jgi:hypothetical protein
MAFPPTCRINRYYDPSTDSFISVDPDVQQTDQPYVFVNGDPLNATDPLGLQGGAGIEAAQEYRNAVAKKCDGHPERDGCRGLDLGVDLTKAVVFTGALIGGAACVAATAGICGAAAFTVGGIEFSGGAIAVGIATGAAEGATDYALSPGKHSVQGFEKSAALGAASDAVYVGIPEEAIFGGLGEGAHAVQLTWFEALRYLPRYLLSALK